MPMFGFEFSVIPASLRMVEVALQAEIAKIKHASTKGLVEAGILVQRDAAERTPVSSKPGTGGTLKASLFTEEDLASEKPAVYIGYGAVRDGGFHYSWAVHDDPNAGVGGPQSYPYKSTVGESEFLKKAVEENKDLILDMIGDAAMRGI